jgi:5-formyltetrahydrofolate cyclo-ligase
VTDVDSPKDLVRRTKAAWRSRALAVRRELSESEQAAAGKAIAEHVLAAPALEGARKVAAYVPVRGEPGSIELLDAMRARGIEVLLPVALPTGSLDWARYGGLLVPAGYGLLEPAGRRLGPGALAEVDLVLAPALAVDRRGVRLGRGMGYYDRALVGLDAMTVVVLLYDCELVDGHLPAEPHDRPVDAVVTPLLGWVEVG